MNNITYNILNTYCKQPCNTTGELILVVTSRGVSEWIPLKLLNNITNNRTYSVSKNKNYTEKLYTEYTYPNSNKLLQNIQGYRGNNYKTGDINILTKHEFIYHKDSDNLNYFQKNRRFQDNIGFSCDTRFVGFMGFQGFQGFQGQLGNIGILGNQGNIGFQGQQGTTGNNGIIGNENYIGNKGFQGHQGNIGFQGQQGNTGSVGIIGNQSYIGFQGFQGHQGNTGSVGIIGNQSYIGFQGFQGQQGYIGFQNLSGNIGYIGDIGNTGNLGNLGNLGNSGNSGYIGNLGTLGNSGVANTGNTGIIGYQGFQNIGFQGFVGGSLTPQADIGFTGNQGTQGTQGTQGQSGSLSYTYITFQPNVLLSSSTFLTISSAQTNGNDIQVFPPFTVLFQTQATFVVKVNLQASIGPVTLFIFNPTPNLTITPTSYTGSIDGSLDTIFIIQAIGQGNILFVAQSPDTSSVLINSNVSISRIL